MAEIAPPPSVDFSGVWHNGLGSAMDLSISGNLVSGIYKTNVGSPKPTEEFPVTGFVTGDLICFSANFGKYGSLTTWAGQHTETKPGVFEIKTLWHLAKDVPDSNEPKEMWSAVWAGANDFSRN